MPHPLPLLAAAVAPLLALGVHAAAPARAVGVPGAHAAATLPNNLCASCHGSRRVASAAASRMGLDARELAATRAYLRTPQAG